MTICHKICELLHNVALLAATPVIFYSVASFCLGCVGKSSGLLVNFRACPRGFPNLLQFGKSSETGQFSLRLIGLLNWLVGLFSVKYLSVKYL